MANYCGLTRLERMNFARPYLERTRRHRFGCLMLCLSVMIGCGANPGTSRIDTFDEDLASLVSRPALQMYLVLTDESEAMQGKAAVADMWKAVRGEASDFGFMRDALRRTRVPPDYRVDVELDFAELPHPKLTIQRLEPMLKRLPPEFVDRARAANLGISIRSRSKSLPAAMHIRFVGAAALHVAEKHNGIVLDLLARRAYTADGWRKELSATTLSRNQYRWSRGKTSDGLDYLISRGHVKFGTPDLMVGPVRRKNIQSAKALFIALHRRVRIGGAKIGQKLSVGTHAFLVRKCGAIRTDGGCVRVVPKGF